MPYKPHYRVTAQGVFLGTTEQWSYSLSLARFGLDDASVLVLQPNDAVWQDIANDFGNFHSSPAAGITGTAELRTVKIAPIGTDGKYSGAPVVKAVQTGGAGVFGYVHPTQCALAVSTVTDEPLGRVKGRFYLPGRVEALDQSGRITQGAAEAVRGAADTLISALNNQPGMDVLGLGVCVPSLRGGGLNYRVTGVKVGRVMDTIRTRRNQMIEAYTTTAAVDV